jgi:hypothetical protein
MLDKLLGILSLAGFAVAFVFYCLFNKEKATRLKVERIGKVKNIKDKKVAEAKKVAKEKHDDVKAKGGAAVAHDLADMLDED